MRSARVVNLTIRFALELCLLAAFGYWGASLGGVGGVVLAVGAIAATLVVWWLFVAPKAPRLLSRGAWVAVQVVLFGLAGIALWRVGSGTLGIVFLVAALGNLALVIALGDAPT